MIKCIVNNKTVETSLHPASITLDLIREELRLTGTKEGCREGECGACTILLGELQKNGQMKYKTSASCLLPIGEIENKHIVTIEGLNSELLTPVQQSVFDNNASQCGFCTPGIVLSLTGFLLSSQDFNYQDAINALDGNMCRCTGYVSIMNAAKAVSTMFQNKKTTCPTRIKQLIEWEVLPPYFNDIPKQLKTEKPESEIRGLWSEEKRDGKKNVEEARATTKPCECVSEDGTRLLIEDRIKTTETQYLSPTETSASKLIAGGTDLFVQQPEELCKCKLEFISKYPELSVIAIEEDYILKAKLPSMFPVTDSNLNSGNKPIKINTLGYISIGGGVTIEEFRKSDITAEYLPSIKNDLLLMSSTLIRNRATIAGNIVNASPIGDLTIILLALNSLLEISDRKSTRIVSLKDFYKDYKKYDLNDNEIIKSIKIPKPAGNAKFNFEKVSNRKYLDIASCNSAIYFECRDDMITNVMISAGGVAAIPMLLSKTSEFLNNKTINSDTIRKAGKILLNEVRPIDDIRGSAKYKKLLLRQLLYAHFIKFFPELSSLLEVK